MSSSQALKSTDSNSQRCHPSARLSLAILELDKLIIRVSQLNTLPDRPTSEGHTCLYVPHPSIPTDISDQEN
jgi:hypothetical protein